jgi:hypothetical protein
MAKPPKDLAAREPAVQSLITRAQRLRNRAARARAGSNERQKCIAQALMLAACAQEIATDATLKTDWSAGWRTLADVTVRHVRQRDKVAS